MKRNLFASIACAAMAGTLLTGCLEGPTSVFNPNAAKEEFEANWESEFGTPDPQQNWNTATRATATVSVAYTGDYTAKIYTSDPRDTEQQAYLLGKMDVKGNQSASLSLNIPAAQTEVYVALVDKDMKRVVKSATVSDGRINVQFGGAETRTVTPVSDGTVTATESEDYLYYDKTDCQLFLDVVPEEKENIGNVVPNFLYESTGKFTIYPMYCNSDNTGMTLGIYYYVNGTLTKQQIWSRTDYIETEYANWDNSTYWKAENLSYQYNIYGTGNFRCKGIVIDVPVGTQFGFYITNGSDDFYSEKELNAGYGDDGCYGATFYDNGNTLYLAFEDWKNHTPKDLNDLVCKVVGNVSSATPKIIDLDKDPDPTPEPDPDDDKAMPWILLCEDLGSTDDFDFNDVVFSVSYTAGETTATVTPLAAGGTLETYIMRGTEVVGEEIHAMLGSSNTGKMINTSSKGAAGTSVTINVSDLDMTTNMGNFYIKVVNKNGYSTNVTAPGNGEAPQMICIGGAKGISWPTERTRIDVAYPGFNAWGEDYQSNPDWYDNPASGKVIQ